MPESFDAVPTAPARGAFRSRLIASVVSLSVVLFAISPSIAAVATDQADYAPGSVVTISGDNSNFAEGGGYQPGETVRVDVLGPNGYTASCETLVAEGGTWSCQVTLWASLDAVGNYTYTATGLTSGTVETGEFLDNASTSITSWSTTPALPVSTWLKNASISGGTGFDVTVQGSFVCNTLGNAANSCASPTKVRVEIRADDTNPNSATGALWVSKDASISGTGGAGSTFGPVTIQFRTSGGDVGIPSGRLEIRAVLVATVGTPGVANSDAPNPDVEDNAFGVDNVAPSFDITGETPSGANVDVAGTTSDSPSGVQTIDLSLYDDVCSGTPLTTGSLITPASPWSKNLSGGTAPGTYCVLGVATDKAGNTTSDTFTYSVNEPPSVSSHSPDDDAIGVAVASDIVVTFSEAVTVDETGWLQLTCGGPAISGTTSGNGTNLVTFNPGVNLPATTLCSAQVQKNQVEDADAGNMVDNHTWTFTTASANTSPSVVVTEVSDGASYAKDSVPVAGCDVTDAEDGDSSFAASLSAITGDDAAYGVGSQTATCEYTDGGGLYASASATYDITDGTAPSISYVLTPLVSDGENGWYTGPVTLDWTVDEGDSPSTLLLTGCDDQSLSADQAEVTYSCSASSAGGSAGPVDVSIKIDGTAPMINDLGPTTDANGNGWYNADVDNEFSASDGLSGLDADCQAAFSEAGDQQTQTTTGEGEDLTVWSDGCSDMAGNSADPVESDPFDVDQTAPTADVTGLSDGDVVYLGDPPPTIGCDEQDGLSGVALSASLTTTPFLNTNGVGYIVYECDGHTDDAGNTGDPVYETLYIQYDAADLGGILQPINQDGSSLFSRGRAIPVKFRIAGDEPVGFDTSGWRLARVSVSCQLLAEGTVLESVGSVTPSSVFRYDGTADQYIYNADFRDKSSGSCWKVRVFLDDGIWDLSTTDPWDYSFEPTNFDSAVFKLQK